MAAKLPLGLGLLGAGVGIMWGGVSGRLAPMLAALFDPALLQPAASAEGGGFPLLDINPPRGGELVPPGHGPGASLPPTTTGGSGALPVPLPPTSPIGPGTPAIGSGGPVIDVVPLP